MTKTHNTEHKEHHKNTEDRTQKLEAGEINELTEQNQMAEENIINQKENENKLKTETNKEATKTQQKILLAETENLKTENLELKDQFLRLKADFDNYKKRILRERQEQELRIKAETISPFINILDNLERARNSAENSEIGDQKSENKTQKLEENKNLEFRDQNLENSKFHNERLNSILQGIDLIIKNLHSILSAMGVEKIKTIGELFNPNSHETLIAEEKEDCVEGTILEELAAGYKIKDVIIRTAKVKVAKQKEKVS